MRLNSYRLRGVFASTRPQFVPSRLAFHDLDALGSGNEVDGLRLNEPGEDGADDPGVVFAVLGTPMGFV
ncbi:hypothetical protein N7493_010812 [Penicillium malachiteum]|uniref:Uncharacterized protein n=1 Tax=Penicillium malachiteum TaxID=1324776 RepID=A0AAD6MS17_9EURO|nr:hypothetical protein N7493_010812 [Penicillium malachiteum]